MRLTAAQSTCIVLLAAAINIYIRLAAFNEYHYCLGEAVTFVLLLIVIIGRSNDPKTVIEQNVYEFVLILTMLNALDELLREALQPTLRELVVSIAAGLCLIGKLLRIAWKRYKLKT